MFKILFTLTGFLLMIFFWQDISPYFQQWTAKFDTFMLHSNELMTKIFAVFEKSDTLSDSVQHIQDLQDIEPSQVPPAD